MWNNSTKTTCDDGIIQTDQNEKLLPYADWNSMLRISELLWIWCFFISVLFFFLRSPRCSCGTEDWTVMCSLLNLGSFCHRGLVEVRVYFGCGLRQKKKSIVADNVYVDVGSRSMGCWISAEYFTSAPMYFVSAPQKT